MDTGEGHLKPFGSKDELEAMRLEFPKSGAVFVVGEELEIKGSRFRVYRVTPFGILLKVLKKD